MSDLTQDDLRRMDAREAEALHRQMVAMQNNPAGFGLSGWGNSNVYDPHVSIQQQMMQVAETALDQQKRQEALDNAIKQFEITPNGDTLYELLRAFSNSGSPLRMRDLTHRIISVLRSQWLRDPNDTDPKDPLLEGHYKMATKAFLTPPGTVSFLNLEKPRIMPGVVNQDPRYSMVLIFDKAAQASPEFRALQEGCQKAALEFFKNKIPANLRSCFRDGGEKSGQYDGYKAGDIFIQPWSKNKPGVVNRQRQEVIDFTEFHAGWLARAFVRPFAYEQAGNKGVGLFLDVVQFLKPGRRLDGRMNATEAFPQDAHSEEEDV